MSQALYRKYRSRSLSELVGQEHVTTVLARALEKGQVSHAYLLTGPRGVGKTSIARILAHAINGIEYVDDATDLDIIEIDAASNRRIDDIRDLRERVHIAPSHARYKVYIIDEVHMLTGESFNALLKTLEEPPAHVVFILATTEIDKLPATITSRTQTFHFRRIPPEVMKPHLRGIADKEGITIDDEALDAIAAHSDGSLRDAETALDQVRHTADGAITREMAEATLGSIPHQRVDSLLAAVRQHDAASIASLLQELEGEGISASLIARDLSRRLLSDEANFETLNLLDALLEVPKSYSPNLKLFSVLMRASTFGKTATVTVVAPVIKEVVKEPAKAAPKVTAKKPVEKASDTLKVPEPVKEVAPAAPLTSEPFDWDKLIAHAKQNFIVLHSVLSKCQYNYDGETLTLYSRFKLHKNKLEDPKYRTMLDKALESLTGGLPEIAIVFGAKPITDENLAGIAAIMGGGEEVNV